MESDSSLVSSNLKLLKEILVKKQVKFCRVIAKEEIPSYTAKIDELFEKIYFTQGPVDIIFKEQSFTGKIEDLFTAGFGAKLLTRSINTAEKNANTTMPEIIETRINQIHQKFCKEGLLKVIKEVYLIKEETIANFLGNRTWDCAKEFLETLRDNHQKFVDLKKSQNIDISLNCEMQQKEFINRAKDFFNLMFKKPEEVKSLYQKGYLKKDESYKGSVFSSSSTEIKFIQKDPLKRKRTETRQEKKAKKPKTSPEKPKSTISKELQYLINMQ